MFWVVASHFKLSQAKSVNCWPILSLLTINPIGCTSKSLKYPILFESVDTNELTESAFAVSTAANSVA